MYGILLHHERNNTYSKDLDCKIRGYDDFNWKLENNIRLDYEDGVKLLI